MPITDLFHKKRYADEATRQQRLKVCLTCPRLSKLKRCLECGCFVNLKTRLTTEKCPLVKW